MQLKKQMWKQTRGVKPCRACGKDHPTQECLTRSGARRAKDLTTYGNQLFTIAN